MQLDRPAPPGDRFVNEHNVGNLLVIEVLSNEYGVMTENGPADCVRANVHVIQPPGTISASYPGTLVFGKVLFSRLSQSVGKAVVGLFTGQPGVKVQGKNVAYDLEDPSDAMMEAASRAMMSRPQAQQPATQGAGPWGQPPVTGQQAWGQQPNIGGPPPVQQPQQQTPWGGQQPAAAPQGPPPGWGQPPAPQQPAQGPWGQAPAPDQSWGQQQLPVSPPVDESVPPWERQQAQQPAWGGQQ